MKARPSGGELGCASVLAAFSLILIGWAAVSFASFYYSVSRLWAAWPWIGLFLVGAIGPASILATIARRSRRLTIALTLWMIVALFLSFGLAFNSGGGV